MDIQDKPDRDVSSMISFDTLPTVLRPVSANKPAKSNFFTSDQHLGITATTDNIVWNNDTDESIVYLRSGRLNPPMGGVSFNMNPILHNDDDVVVSLGVRYSVMFPAEFHWGQGGHLPELFGNYTSAVATTAAANNLFEGKCRWDAKGKLGISIKQNFEHDPFEWQIDPLDKIQLVRDVWYEICLVAHIDGAFQVVVNESPLFSGSSHLGFDRIDGVRFCAYCVDNLGKDDSFMLIRGVEIKAKIDSE